MKKFIFITRYFYPSCTGIPRIVSDIAFDLAAKGHDVRVLASQLDYENPHRLLPSTETIFNVKITRISAILFQRTSLIGRVINYCGFYISCIFRLLNLTKQNDVVIVLSEPPLISSLVAKMIKFRRAKLINWIQDIHPEISEQLGLFFARGWTGRLLRYIRNIGWKKAIANIVLGKRMANFVQGQGIHPERINIYPNWEDGDLIRPLPIHENKLRLQWNLEKKFVAGYSGNFGRAHDFKTIIDTATYFAQQADMQDIIFLLIGDGYYKKYLEHEITQRNLANVILKPYQPREQLRESLNIPDVHLISAIPAVEGLLVPGKLTSATAVGRPVLFIGDQEGEVAQILRLGNCGESICMGDTTALVNAILKLRNDSTLREQWGKNARIIFDKHFDKSVAMSRLCEFLVSL